MLLDMPPDSPETSFSQSFCKDPTGNSSGPKASRHPAAAVVAHQHHSDEKPTETSEGDRRAPSIVDVEIDLEGDARGHSAELGPDARREDPLKWLQDTLLTTFHTSDATDTGVSLSAQLDMILRDTKAQLRGYTSLTSHTDRIVAQRHAEEEKAELQTRRGVALVKKLFKTSSEKKKGGKKAGQQAVTIEPLEKEDLSELKSFLSSSTDAAEHPTVSIESPCVQLFVTSFLSWCMQSMKGMTLGPCSEDADETAVVGPSSGSCILSVFDLYATLLQTHLGVSLRVFSATPLTSEEVDELPPSDMLLLQPLLCIAEEAAKRVAWHFPPISKTHLLTSPDGFLSCVYSVGKWVFTPPGSDDACCSPIASLIGAAGTHPLPSNLSCMVSLVESSFITAINQQFTILVEQLGTTQQIMSCALGTRGFFAEYESEIAKPLSRAVGSRSLEVPCKQIFNGHSMLEQLGKAFRRHIAVETALNDDGEIARQLEAGTLDMSRTEGEDPVGGSKDSVAIAAASKSKVWRREYILRHRRDAHRFLAAHKALYRPRYPRNGRVIDAAVATCRAVTSILASLHRMLETKESTSVTIASTLLVPILNAWSAVLSGVQIPADDSKLDPLRHFSMAATAIATANYVFEQVGVASADADLFSGCHASVDLIMAAADELPLHADMLTRSLVDSLSKVAMSAQHQEQLNGLTTQVMGYLPQTSREVVRAGVINTLATATTSTKAELSYMVALQEAHHGGSASTVLDWLREALEQRVPDTPPSDDVVMHDADVVDTKEHLMPCEASEASQENSSTSSQQDFHAHEEDVVVADATDGSVRNQDSAEPVVVDEDSSDSESVHIEEAVEEHASNANEEVAGSQSTSPPPTGSACGWEDSDSSFELPATPPPEQKIEIAAAELSAEAGKEDTSGNADADPVVTSDLETAKADVDDDDLK